MTRLGIIKQELEALRDWHATLAMDQPTGERHQAAVSTLDKAIDAIHIARSAANKLWTMFLRGEAARRHELEQLVRLIEELDAVG